MTVHCHRETRQLLLRLNLFKGLDESELMILLSRAELVDCAEGEYVVREGEQGHEMFVILSGKVRISKRSGSVQKVIHELGPGECFGEMSLVECRSRSASVKALEPCKLMRIDGASLSQLFEISAKLYRNIAILLSQRLRHANDLLTLG